MAANIHIHVDPTHQDTELQHDPSPRHRRPALAECGCSLPVATGPLQYSAVHSGREDLTQFQTGIPGTGQLLKEAVHG